MRKIYPSDITRHPNSSSVAAAFAAIKVPWHDARMLSLHHNTSSESSFADLAGDHKVVFLTRPGAGPVFIARQLVDLALSSYRFCVLENLRHPGKEAITWFDDSAQVLAQCFEYPNVVIFLKKDPVHPPGVSHETHQGITDDRYRHADGLITKSEIRSITLARLTLMKDDYVIWDIGSGSGSVAIEASIAVPLRQVVTIEKTTPEYRTSFYIDLIQELMTGKKNHFHQHDERGGPNGIRHQ